MAPSKTAKQSPMAAPIKEASALEQLNMMQALIETDQQTVAAIGARLAAINNSLKELARRLAARNR